jgi:cobalt/nickel transport protein
LKQFILFFTAIALTFGSVVPVSGHFQLLYTVDPALNAGRATNLLLLFTHPSHGGPNMAMGKPEALYVVSQRGDADPVKTDLSQYLKPVMWSGEQGDTPAYEASMPAAVTRSLGDYVFVLQPSPYYEKGEDKYIQQFTKMIMNVGGVPGNWAEPVGLPTEILPLNKPYANWTGSVFRGVVLSEGKPAPDAELEVEYINYAADLTARRFAAKPYVVLPQGSFGTMSIRANDRGEFTVGLPRSGWWGICALDAGPVKEHQGKPLSQDAVIWVHVRDMQ